MLVSYSDFLVVVQLISLVVGLQISCATNRKSSKGTRIIWPTEEILKKLATRPVAELYRRRDASLVGWPTAHTQGVPAARCLALILLNPVYPHLIRPVEFCLNCKIGNFSHHSIFNLNNIYTELD